MGRGHLPIGRGCLPIDLALLSCSFGTAAFNRLLPTLDAFAFACLGGSLPLVGNVLALVRALFPVIGDAVSLIADVVALIGVSIPLVGNSLPPSEVQLTLGERAVALCNRRLVRTLPVVLRVVVPTRAHRYILHRS